MNFYYNFQIQADNCWSENKNRYVLGFLAKLVQDEVFKTVELHFLLQGHTHEDIDALFSKIKNYMRLHSVLTISDLKRTIEEHYKQTTARLLPFPEVLDFKEYFGTEQIKKMKFMSVPHAFQFQKVQKIYMHFKFV